MKKGDYDTGPPNMYTNPGKKGSYGFNKTTIGERLSHKGVAGEYEYKADPFDAGVQAVREYEKTKRDTRITDLPFRPANPPKRGGYGVPGTTLHGKVRIKKSEILLGTRFQKIDGPCKKTCESLSCHRIEFLQY